MCRCRSKKGFTLTELLIVVAIIAVLAAVSIPVFGASLDRAGRAVDQANARSLKSLLAVSYMDGTIQFPNAEYKGSSTALAVYATRDEVKYFASGSMTVDGRDWNSDGEAFARVKQLVAGAGLGDMTVRCKNLNGSGWDYCAVVLYSDGTVRVAGNPGSLGLSSAGDGFEASLKSGLPAGTTNLEKAMSGGE